MQNKVIRQPSKGTIGFHSEQDKFAFVLSHERSEFSWDNYICNDHGAEKCSSFLFGESQVN